MKTIKELEKEIEKEKKELINMYGKYWKDMHLNGNDADLIKLKGKLVQTKAICEMIEGEPDEDEDSIILFKKELLSKIKGEEK